MSTSTYYDVIIGTTIFLENKYKAKETWHDKDGNAFHPGIHYNVGGNSKVYGAALLRMRAQDFGGAKRHGGISPEWPIRCAGSGTPATGT